MRCTPWLVLVFVCIACATQVGSTSETTTSDQNPAPSQVKLFGRWELVGFQDPSDSHLEPVPEYFHRNYVMTLADEGFRLSGPLNTLTADLSASRDGLQLENFLVTEMSSTDATLLQWEQKLFSLLHQSIAYDIQGDELIFSFHEKDSIVWKWAPEE